MKKNNSKGYGYLKTKYSDIIDAAMNAGKILLKYHKKNIEIGYKRDKFDPVTVADKESDEYLRKQIKKVYPKDEILSEEGNILPNEYQKKRVWMVDPLDGTKDFIAGVDSFSILIGLTVKGKPVFGLVYTPVRERLWIAEKGKGAYYVENKHVKKIHVSKISRLSEAKMVTRNNYSNPRDLDIVSDSLNVKKKIPEGSSGIKICRIANGDFDIHVNTNYATSKWDTCGPQVILEEAGGKISTLEGKPIDYIQKSPLLERSFFATNKILHKEAHKEISKILPKVESFKK